MFASCMAFWHSIKLLCELKRRQIITIHRFVSPALKNFKSVMRWFKLAHEDQQMLTKEKKNLETKNSKSLRKFRNSSDDLYCVWGEGFQQSCRQPKSLAEMRSTDDRLIFMHKTRIFHITDMLSRIIEDGWNWLRSRLICSLTADLHAKASYRTIPGE